MDLGSMFSTLIKAVWSIMSKPISFSFFGQSFTLSFVFIEVGILIISLSLYLLFKIIK